MVTLLAATALGVALWLFGLAAGEDGHPAEKRRYLAAADAVCRAAAQEADTDGLPPDTPQAAVAELRRSAAAMTRAAAALKALLPPRRDSDIVRRRFVQPAGELAVHLTGLAEEAKKELAAGREEAAVTIVERSLAQDETEVALRSFAGMYGLRTCAGEEERIPGGSGGRAEVDAGEFF